MGFIIKSKELSDFETWLKKNTPLSKSSISSYIRWVNMFLKRTPNIELSKSYNNFLIETAYGEKKRGYPYYYALQKYIEFKFEPKIQKEILKNIIRPKMKDRIKDPKQLSKNQRIELINELTDKSRIIALIQTFTGARIGDILKLQRGDISIEIYKGEKILKINLRAKGDKRNVVYINEKLKNISLVNIISTYCKVGTEKYINYLSKGKRIEDIYYFLETPKHKEANREEHFLVGKEYEKFRINLKMALNSLTFKTKDEDGNEVIIDTKDFSTHDFRRCFGKDIYEKTKDIIVLKGALHHSRIDTTIRYIKQSGEKDKDTFLEY